MKKIIVSVTVILALLITALAMCVGAEAFSDVNKNDWFYNDVNDALSLGLMTGVGGGKFEPRRSITRAELTAVFARMSGDAVKGMGKYCTFTDVTKDKWYYDYLGWAQKNGLAGGYPDGTFKPNNPILRQEMSKFVSLYIRYTGAKLTPSPKIVSFTDKSIIPSWAAEFVEELRIWGLVAGDSSGNFNPKGSTTRAEFATLTVRLNSKIVPPESETTESEITELESSEPETTEPETSKPETSEPETSEPETTEPETSKPETSEPETTEPETTEPETTEPETSEPETTEPETSEPDTSEPETSEPDTSEPDTSEPETSEPDTSEPETTEPESTEPETSEPETTEPETTEPETTKPETSEPETTEPETSEPETTEPETTEPHQQDPVETDTVMINAFNGYASKVTIKSERVHYTFSPYDTITSAKIGEKFLSEIGLNSTDYSLEISNSQISTVASDFSVLGAGNSIFKTLTVAVKNNTTGEKTEVKSIKFAFTKEFTGTYVDISSFNSGIAPDIYDEMKVLSNYNTGNISRLSAFFKKAENGEMVNVAYIGGSITEGTAYATDGKDTVYCKLVSNWIEKNYPNAYVNHFNAGWSGTPSPIGCTRYNVEVAPNEPDLVFIEFAVNDIISHKEAFESLLRTALSGDGNPAVVVLLSQGGSSAKSANSGTYQYMKELSVYYKVPVVDFCSAYWYGIGQKAFVDTDIAPDYCHPGEYGNKVYADMIVYLFEQVLEARKEASPSDLVVSSTLPASVSKCKLEGITLNNSKSVKVVGTPWYTTNYYHYGEGWFYMPGCNTSMTFEVTGKNIYLVYNDNSNYADLKITVDGKAVSLSPIVKGTNYECALINSTGKTSDKHTIVITIASGQESKQGILYGIAVK